MPNPSQINTMDRGGIAYSFQSYPVTGPIVGDIFGIIAGKYSYQLPPHLTWEVQISGGTYSTLTIALEGSIDGVQWYQLDSNFNALTNVMQHVVNKPVREIRANVTAATVASGSPAVSVLVTM